MTEVPPISLGFALGDVIIVTGGASGIGRATALNAAAVGLAVAVWDLDPVGTSATVDAIQAAGGRALGAMADVTDDAQVDAALTASAELGSARYLVNNAGPASSSRLEFEEALGVSVGSMRRVTTKWLERDHQDGRSVVNISSVAGNHIGTFPDWYPAAKAAITGYTRYLAAFCSDEVRSNAVAPSMTETPRIAGYAETELGQRALARIPLHRLATADEVAWAVLFLLSPLASYINGVLLTVDGGWMVTQ